MQIYACTSVGPHASGALSPFITTARPSLTYKNGAVELIVALSFAFIQGPVA